MSATLHAACPRCGHKLSAFSALSYATMPVRRKCRCGRRYVITPRPIEGHDALCSVTIVECVPRVTEAK